MSKPLVSRLSHTSLLILLALSLRPRHGYELLLQIEEDSKHTVKLEAGTLYGAIKLLREIYLIEEIPFADKPRRRQYRLTRKGWDTLETELQFYQQLVSLAKERRVI